MPGVAGRCSPTRTRTWTYPGNNRARCRYAIGESGVLLCPRQESNLHLRLRKPVPCPLDHRGVVVPAVSCGRQSGPPGDRTRNPPIKSRLLCAVELATQESGGAVSLRADLNRRGPALRGRRSAAELRRRRTTVWPSGAALPGFEPGTADPESVVLPFTPQGMGCVAAPVSGRCRNRTCARPSSGPGPLSRRLPHQLGVPSPGIGAEVRGVEPLRGGWTRPLSRRLPVPVGGHLLC
jgi:hypothetical protein